MGNSKWMKLIAGILMILAATFSFFMPFEFAGILLWVVAGLVLLAGILHLILFFRVKDAPGSSVILFDSLLQVLLGLLFLFSSTVFKGLVMSTWIAVWVLISGAIRIFASFSLKRAGLKRWWLTLLTGILMILAGILIVLHPAIALLGISIYIGIYLLFYGLLAVCEFIAD